MLNPVKFGMNNRQRILLVIALSIAGLCCSAMEAQVTAVTGMLKDRSGQPVAGALVKVSSKELGLGFMVVTGAQGRYITPNLRPGSYMVQGFGGENQSVAMGIEIHTGQQGKMDLTLDTPLVIPPPRKRMTDADYAKLMPEGKGKSAVVSRCAMTRAIKSAPPPGGKAAMIFTGLAGYCWAESGGHATSAAVAASTHQRVTWRLRMRIPLLRPC